MLSWPQRASVLFNYLFLSKAGNVNTFFWKCRGIRAQMVVKESRSTGSELQHLVLGTQTPFSPAPKYGPFLIIENLFLVFLKLEHILYQYSIYKSVKHSASRHSFAISISKEIFSSLRIYKRVWFPLNLPLFQNKTKFFFLTKKIVL